MDDKPRILLVDDEENFVKATAGMLASCGFEVRTVTSGEDALRLVESVDFDLVVIDFSMPEMDGLELIRRLRQLRPNQRIIVASGFPSQYAQIAAFKAGALYYITKPFSFDLFLELITEVLKRELDMRGSVRLSLDELLQLYALAEKTLLLEVQSNGKKGLLYLRKGELIHAETEKLKGKEAFYRIQSYRNGIFSVRSYNKRVVRTIDQSVNALLLEGARMKDERMRDYLVRARGGKKRL